MYWYGTYWYIQQVFGQKRQITPGLPPQKNKMALGNYHHPKTKKKRHRASSPGLINY